MCLKNSDMANSSKISDKLHDVGRSSLLLLSGAEEVVLLTQMRKMGNPFLVVFFFQSKLKAVSESSLTPVSLGSYFTKLTSVTCILRIFTVQL